MLLVILYWRKSDCNENLENYRIDYKRKKKFKIYEYYKFGIFVLSHLTHKFHVEITLLYVCMFESVHNPGCVFKNILYSEKHCI